MLKRRVKLIPVLLLLASLALGAQAPRPVVRVLPLKGAALPAGELAALQNLVVSAVVELDSWRIVDDAGQELALREAESAAALGQARSAAPLSADFLLGGSVLEASGALVFSLELTKVLSGEKRSVSETLQGSSETILAARRLVRGLFSREAAVAAPLSGPSAAGSGAAAGGSASSPAGAAPARDEAPSLAKLAGNWGGDKGVERVSLFADGRGIALLSSGASMRLRATIQGATVAISQDQANLPDFFKTAGISAEQARKVAQLARPARWVFSLSATGASLVGLKETVFVRIDSGGAVSVDNGYTREASWTRLAR